MAPPSAALRAKIVLAYLAVSIVWGSTYYGIRLALEGFPPFLLGAARFLVAGSLLFAFLRLRGARGPTPREWGSAAITGALFFVVGNGLVNLAERSVSSGLASVLVATMPLWATVFARIGGERASAREAAGVALGLGGVVVMNLGGDLRASGAGALFALLAPMGWALGTVASRRLPLPGGAMTTAAQMLSGGAALLVVGLASGERMHALPGIGPLAAVAYLTVFGSLVGFSAYVFLIRSTRATVATSYAYVNPVIAIALGTLLGGERFGLTSAAGAAIILAAVLLVSRAKARAPGETARLTAPPASAEPERAATR